MHAQEKQIVKEVIKEDPPNKKCMLVYTAVL